MVPRPGVSVLGRHTLIRGQFHAQRQGFRTNWTDRYETGVRIGVFEFKKGGSGVRGR